MLVFEPKMFENNKVIKKIRKPLKCNVKTKIN